MAFPGQLKVDYVRVYQDASTAMSADNSTMVCSPPNMPTEEYIKAHAGDYAGALEFALSAGRGSFGSTGDKTRLLWLSY